MTHSVAAGAFILLTILLYVVHKSESVLRLRIWCKIKSWLNARSTPSSKLKTLPLLTPLIHGCLRINGCNPGQNTLQGTNTYLFGHGNDKILIDMSDGNAAYDRLVLGVFQTHPDWALTDILITHGHYDHFGNIFSFQRHFPRAKIWKYFPAESSSHLSNTVARKLHIQPLKPSQQFQDQLRVVVTPGHTNDHICVYAETDAVLFSGDCILGSDSSCMFQDLKAYLETLHMLLRLEIRCIYPGHGDVICDDPKAYIERYIAHRLSRETYIYELLRENADQGKTSKALTREIYHQRNLSWMLFHFAHQNVRNHLRKLEQDQRIKSQQVSKLVVWQQQVWYIKRN